MTRQARNAMAGVLHQALLDFKAGRIAPATYKRSGLTREETGLVDHLTGYPILGEGPIPPILKDLGASTP